MKGSEGRKEFGLFYFILFYFFIISVNLSNAKRQSYCILVLVQVTLGIHIFTIFNNIDFSVWRVYADKIAAMFINSTLSVFIF